MQKEQFDVFIAYHDTHESRGSFSEAKLIADYLLDIGHKIFFTHILKEMPTKRTFSKL